MHESQAKVRFWVLCLTEPFRIFFPLGVLVGISGVSLWPLYFTGIHSGFYPGVMHGRMMIEGFMGALVLGFLGTAVPRLTGTGPWSSCGLATALVLYAGAIGTHIGQQYLAADCIFLALLLVFAGSMISRFARCTDMPPPEFVLVAFGFANAIVGTVLLIAGAAGTGSPRCTTLGSLLLYQGFVLYLLLGLAGFLLPRFLQLPREEFPDARNAPPGWWSRATVAIGVGAVLLATFVAEVFTPFAREAGFIRFAAAGLFLFATLPLHRASIPRTTMTAALRLALVLLITGLLFPVLWPMQRVAGMHVLFIGGFTLVSFTVATRVVLGHSGHSDLFAQRLPFLASATLLLVMALGLRVAGDFLLASRPPMLNWASYLWMLAAVVWSWRVLPKVRIPDPEA
jgi:uncharacterized protein involved in response to NO